MSSLNARHGWKFKSIYGESSDVPSGNLEIVLSSNMPTSPLIPSSPTLALRNIGDWYDNFNGPFTSHRRTVHSDISSVSSIPVREPRFQNCAFHSDVELLKLGAMQLRKSVRPDDVESSFYELRDDLGSGRQELACSPTMSPLSVDEEMAIRVTGRLQDEEDGEEI